MIERYSGQDTIESVGFAVALILILCGLVFVLIWEPDPVPVAIPEGSYLDSAGAVVPIPNGMMLINGTLISIPTPIPTPTPRQTPVALPTIKQQPIDPFIHGERWEGQWFMWERKDVSGLKDMFVGIVAYRHVWLDKYTWWNAATGNYQVQKPTAGNRYFAVWINQEMFGDNQTFDSRMWGFTKDAFRLQYRDRLIEADTSHKPVNRILEFDEIEDYHKTETAHPFGYDIIYTGHDPTTAGMAALEIGYLRLGPGNSIDGYILFEVPKNAMAEDVIILGSFSRFGTAYWRFDD